MFPWQSGSDGTEETQRRHLNPLSGLWEPDLSHNQRHVNAAVFYNIWRYVKTTGDHAFLSDYGAEIMLEIARFWASMTTNWALWRDMSRRMFVPFHDAGIISQFEGYDDLDELDWDAYRAKYGNIQRLDRILRGGRGPQP